MTCLISLVVLGFRNFENTTRPCLESLIPWLDDGEIEILVIDNGSPDDSAQKTQQWCDTHPQVTCLLSDHNRGYAGGMNWGASHASGKWLLLINNDTLFPKFTLDALKRVIAELPSDVAMLGPLSNEAGNGQKLWWPGATLDEWLQIGAQLHEQPAHLLMPTYRCDFFTIAIRRDVWNELSGLDTAFGLGYYEDFDFSLRLTKAGFRQMITEDVFVAHLGSASFKADKHARELIRNNKKKLKLKHKNVIFESVREANLKILKEYLIIKELKNGWSFNEKKRIRLRLSAIDVDVPKSIYKRYFWIFKVNKVLRELWKGLK